MVTLFQLYIMMPSQAYDEITMGDWKALNPRLMAFGSADDFISARQRLYAYLNKGDSHDTVRAHYLLGNLCDDLGDQINARQHYQRALSRINASWYEKIIYSRYKDDIYGAMALMDYSHNQNTAALAKLHQIEDMDAQPNALLLNALQDSLENPGRGDFHYELGKELSQDLRLEKARSEMALALKLARDPNLRLSIASYVKTKMPIIESDLPPLVRYYALAGDTYEYDDSQKNLEKASEYYQRAISEAPGFEWGYHELSNVYQDLKEYDQAMRYAQKAAELNPNFYMAHLTMGDIALIQKKYADAARHYSDAESIVSTLQDQDHVTLSANIENELGYSYESLDQLKDAVSHYKKALKLASQDSDDYEYAQDSLKRLKSLF